MVINIHRNPQQPTPVFLFGDSQGQRSPACYIVHGVAKSQTQLKRLSAQHTYNQEVVS